MAIPKLLKQMRHAVQDTGDAMNGSYIIGDVGSLQIMGPKGTDLFALTTSDGTNDIALQFDEQDGIHNTLSFHSNSSDDRVILSGLSDPVNSTDVATKNYVDGALENAGGTFYATYDTTTYAQVVAAYNAGKTVKALYKDTSSFVYIFDLVTRPTGNNTLYFTAHPYNANANVYDITLSLTSTSSWAIVNSMRRSLVSSPLQYNGTTTINTNPYYRPIRVSTSAPTSSDGNVGDIWIQYFS